MKPSPSPAAMTAEDVITDATVSRAAHAWYGRRSKESFPEDIEYFKANWKSLLGLRNAVFEQAAIDYAAALATIDALKAQLTPSQSDVDAAREWITARLERVELGELSKVIQELAEFRAASRGTRALTWQPIETAPKDGTKFLGKCDEDALAMFWHPHFGEFITGCREMVLAKGFTFDDGSTSRLHSPEIRKPTHWMPLLPEPSA